MRRSRSPMKRQPSISARTGVPPVSRTPEGFRRKTTARRVRSASDQTAVSTRSSSGGDQARRISSKSQHQIAEDLGISDVTLRNWVKQAERDEGKRPDGLSTDEREELARLRRENQTLRMEREILKKAAAFFARETGEP